MEKSELMKALETHHEASFGWALFCCRGDRPEAEDVLQTAYLKILDGRARFEGRSEFKTWAFSVIRNTARGRGRLRRRFERFLGRRPPTDIDGRSPEDRVYLGELAQRFQGLLSRLSRKQREVLELVFYHDMSVDQASRVMKVSLGTARTHYHRGKERLRYHWESKEGFDGLGRTRDQEAL